MTGENVALLELFCCSELATMSHEVSGLDAA